MAKRFLEFKGRMYTLNQCEGDIFEWYGTSKAGDYTHMYHSIVFHTDEGCVAALNGDFNDIINI